MGEQKSRPSKPGRPSWGTIHARVGYALDPGYAVSWVTGGRSAPLRRPRREGNRSCQSLQRLQRLHGPSGLRGHIRAVEIVTELAEHCGQIGDTGLVRVNVGHRVPNAVQQLLDAAEPPQNAWVRVVHSGAHATISSAMMPRARLRAMRSSILADIADCHTVERVAVPHEDQLLEITDSITAALARTPAKMRVGASATSRTATNPSWSAKL